MEPTVPRTTTTTAIVRARPASILGTRRRIRRRRICRVHRALRHLLLVLVSATSTAALVESTAATTTTSSKATAAALVHHGLGDVVVHALPTSRAAAAATARHVRALVEALLVVHVAATAASSTTTASAPARPLTLARPRLLLKLLLLLLLLVVIGIIPRAAGTSTTSATAGDSNSSTRAMVPTARAHPPAGAHPALIHPRPTRASTTTRTALLVHHLLHLRHLLLHHSRVHIRRHTRRHATLAGHLLLHLLHLLHVQHLAHGGVHVAVHHHLLLEHGHGLLHALEVLRHDLRRHAGGAGAHAAATAHTAGAAHALAVVHAAGPAHALPLAAKLPAAGPAPARGVLLVAEIAARLGLLDLDRLAVDFEVGREAGVAAGLALERDEAEAARAARVLVHHEGGVDDAPELGKVLAELVVGRLLADAADEDLGCLFLLVAGDGALGVDLEGVGWWLVDVGLSRIKGAHNLAVEVVLLDHDDVDRLRVLEGEEAEAARATGGAVAHNSAFHHFAKLREVVS
jgi:hypothetical protein